MVNQAIFHRAPDAHDHRLRLPVFSHLRCSDICVVLVHGARIPARHAPTQHSQYGGKIIMHGEVPLKTLRPGAVFITHDGICAVKSQYQYNRSHNAQSLCILLENGEIAYFDDGNNTLVREIKCSLDPMLLADEREAR